MASVSRRSDDSIPQIPHKVNYNKWPLCQTCERGIYRNLRALLDFFSREVLYFDYSEYYIDVVRQWVGHLNRASRRKVVTAYYIPPTEQDESTN